jgi:hypothetical protein
MVLENLIKLMSIRDPWSHQYVLDLKSFIGTFQVYSGVPQEANFGPLLFWYSYYQDLEEEAAQK